MTDTELIQVTFVTLVISFIAYQLGKSVGYYQWSTSWRKD